MHFICVNVFSAKVLIGDSIIFTSPTGNGTAILRGHPSHAKAVPTLSSGPVPGIEPATSRSAVKRSTDLADPAAVN